MPASQMAANQSSRRGHEGGFGPPLSWSDGSSVVSISGMAYSVMVTDKVQLQAAALPLKGLEGLISDSLHSMIPFAQ